MLTHLGFMLSNIKVICIVRFEKRLSLRGITNYNYKIINKRIESKPIKNIYLKVNSNNLR